MKVTDILKNVPSMWDILKQTKPKVVLYGMGDGAVKILAILKKLGIECIGIFASDSFVRHQEFCGYTVKSLGELEEEFGDFTVLSAFATRLDEVIENFKKISLSHTLFIPDINVSGDYFELFDREFLEKFKERIDSVYSSLDSYGKEFFKTLLSYKLSGDINYLEKLEELRINAEFPYGKERVSTFADFGAYTGDTVKEAESLYPNLKKVCAFEPDRKNYQKLIKNIGSPDFAFFPINALVYDKNTALTLLSGSSMNTIIEGNVIDSAGLQKKKAIQTEAVTADSAIPFIPDLIKMDVEGCEERAIEGCKNIITKHSPILRVSIYHNHRDIFTIYEKISALYGGYTYTLRQKCKYIPAWDVEIIAF